MKNAQLSELDSGVPVRGSLQFTGTCNPRHLRALHELLRRTVWREELDSIAGTSNSPELVAELRRRGLEIPCQRALSTDRDGRESRPGKYSLSSNDCRLVVRWLATQPKASAT